MVWRNRHRAGRKKRAKFEKLRKTNVPITRIQIRQFIYPQARRQLKRAHLRQKYRDQGSPNSVIDLTSDKPTDSSPSNTPSNLSLGFEFPSPFYSPTSDNFQNTESSTLSHSPVPPEDNRSYDEIFQSLESSSDP